MRPRAAAVPGRWAGPAVGSSWRSREAAARAGGGDASLTGEARPRGRGSAGARGQGRPPVGAFRRGSRGRGVPTCAEPGPPAWRFARGALAEGEPGAGARGFLPASARDRTRALHGVGDWPVVTRGTEVPLLPLPRRNQDEYDSSPGSGGRSGGAGGGPALRLHPQDRGGTPGRVLQVSAVQRQRGSGGAEKRVRGSPWSPGSGSLRRGRAALPTLGAVSSQLLGIDLWQGTVQVSGACFSAKLVLCRGGDSLGGKEVVTATEMTNSNSLQTVQLCRCLVCHCRCSSGSPVLLLTFFPKVFLFVWLFFN